MGKYQEVKNLVRSYFDELEKCAPEESEAVLKKYMSENYIWEGVYPFLDQTTAHSVAEVFWKPLKNSLCICSVGKMFSWQVLLWMEKHGL